MLEVKDRFDTQVPICLLRLRNPWGSGEWTGAWAEGSAEFNKYKPELKEYMLTLPPDEQLDLDVENNDGAFFMAYDDWKDIFSTLFINLDFPEDWTGVRFDSAWGYNNSPGLPTTYTPDALAKYAENPQFLVRVAADTEMMFSMTQTGGRLPVKG